MTTTVSFNPRNFGQYMAGLGAAELATRAGNRAKIGHKSLNPVSTELQIVTDTAVDWTAILQAIRNLTVSGQRRSLNFPENSDSKNQGPITLTLPFTEIELDWWFDDFISKTLRCPFSSQPADDKFRNIASEVKKLNGVADLQSAFDVGFKNGTILYLDRRSVASRNSLGYSPDMVHEATNSFPYIEVLAAIGMQSFRPQSIRIDREDTLRYFLWEKLLPLTEAALALAYPWDGLPGRKMFTTLIPLNSQSSDRYYDWATTEQEWTVKCQETKEKTKEKKKHAKAI